jgi:hypothetical protein
MSTLGGSKENWIKQMNPEQAALNKMIKAANTANAKPEYLEARKLKFDSMDKSKDSAS